VTVVRIGSTGGIPADEVLAAIDAVLPPGAADVRLATLDARAAEIGIIAAAVARHWPLTGYSAGELARMADPTPSDRVAGLMGTASVAS
jgi:cobalt-precorrin 5A hydrolase